MAAWAGPTTRCPRVQIGGHHGDHGPRLLPDKGRLNREASLGLLRDGLPDLFTGWYEPVVGHYSDFCLITDDFGLMKLEVKGWYAGQVARANDHEVELRKSEGEQTRIEVHGHPIRQVREYPFGGLMDQLARPEHAILLRPEGEHRGKPCFPCGSVVLSNVIKRRVDDEAGAAVELPSRASDS